MIQRLILCGFAAGLLLCGGNELARAADDSETAVKALLAEIDKARKDKERTGLEDAVRRVPDVHNGLEKAPLKKKLRAALGKVLKDAKAGNAATAAAEALGRLDDPKGAYAELVKAFPQPKDKDASPLQLEALRATAALAPDSAIPVLVKLMQKAKAPAAAKEAIVALGRYGASKKRADVLNELLDTMSRLYAAAESAGRNPKGGSGGAPWKALGGALVASANGLTGQTFPGGKEWVEAYKANKKKLSALFKDADK